MNRVTKEYVCRNCEIVTLDEIDKSGKLVPGGSSTRVLFQCISCKEKELLRQISYGVPNYAPDVKADWMGRLRIIEKK